MCATGEPEHVCFEIGELLECMCWEWLLLVEGV